MLVLEKQRWMPIFSVLSLVLRLATLSAGALYFDFMTALWLMMGGQILSYLIHSGFFICLGETVRLIKTAETNWHARRKVIGREKHRMNETMTQTSNKI